MSWPTLIPTDPTASLTDSAAAAYRSRFRSLTNRPRRGSCILVAYVLTATAYFLWRSTVINWGSVYGPFVYGAEIYGGLMTSLFLWVVRHPHVPVSPLSQASRTVDAIISTYRETLDVIEPTVLGALRVRGVNSVLLLDDGDRPSVRAMADRLGVAYHARTTNEHAKAGNLNNGLKYSSADFILLLDADHVPSPQFLDRTIAYFDDDRLAFVQTPQTYYNRDSFLFRQAKRRGWSEQGMFYECIQPAKNTANAAFFVGTSAVLRRAAIDEIGGFATGTVTEDIHTSLRLHAAGWRSIFVPEALAYGLEAASLKEFYRQRRRWAAGSLGLLFRSPDSPLRARGLSLAQRLCYLEATLAHLQGVQRLTFFCTPILAVLTLSSPVTVHVAYFAAVFVAFAAFGVTATAVSARGTYSLIYTESYALVNGLAQCAALRGILRVQTRFVESRKSTKRRDPTSTSAVLTVLALLAIASLGRAAQLLVHGTIHRDLLLASAAVIGFNLALLLSFLIFLRRYESRETPAGPEEVPSLVRYDEILELGARTPPTQPPPKRRPAGRGRTLARVRWATAGLFLVPLVAAPAAFAPVSISVEKKHAGNPPESSYPPSSRTPPLTGCAVRRTATGAALVLVGGPYRPCPPPRVSGSDADAIGPSAVIG